MGFALNFSILKIEWRGYRLMNLSRTNIYVKPSNTGCAGDEASAKLAWGETGLNDGPKLSESGKTTEPTQGLARSTRGDIHFCEFADHFYRFPDTPLCQNPAAT